MTLPSSKRYMVRKVAGLCGVITPVVVLTLISLAILYYPRFSWTENALSDLGVQDPAATFFNSSLIIGGVLILTFAMGLREVFSSGALGYAGTLALMLAAVNLCAIGIFPGTAGAIHFYVSVAFFTLLTISTLLIGAAMMQKPPSRNLGLYATAAGIVMIVVWMLPWNGGVAIPEMLASLAASAWAIVLGVRLVRQASRFNGKNCAHGD